MFAAKMRGLESRLAASWIKELRYPGMYPGETSNGGRYITFNTVTVDQIFQMSNGDLQTIYFPSDGYYNLYFEANQPDYPVVGFGNGWSGTGEGQVAIETSRYGREAFSANWGPIGDDSANHLCVTGTIKRYMFAGDFVRGYTRGTATGIGVHDYDPKLIITKLRS